jgi:hypothetical protein
VSLAGSPDGHALLAVDRHAGPTSVVVSVARRNPGGAFGAFADVSPAQFVSDVFGAQAAIADSGIGLVSWASGGDPSSPSSPSGVFAAMSDVSGTFGAPQPLAGGQSAQPTAPTVGSTYALVAWGNQVARAAIP